MVRKMEATTDLMDKVREYVRDNPGLTTKEMAQAVVIEPLLSLLAEGGVTMDADGSLRVRQ